MHQSHALFHATCSHLTLSATCLVQANGCKVALVKSDRDDRYSATHISTHDGLERSCHAVSALADVRAVLGPAYEETEVIAIDEAQFFPDLLKFCAQAADYDCKQVVVAGLDGDFMRKSFGQVSRFVHLPLPLPMLWNPTALIVV